MPSTSPNSIVALPVEFHLAREMAVGENKIPDVRSIPGINQIRPTCRPWRRGRVVDGETKAGSALDGST